MRASKTFIRVVEVWVPDAQQTLLEPGGGWWGDTRRFGSVSRSMCFGRGEGLPGRAWDTGRPIVLRQLHGNYFRRGEAAAAEGLTCAIAWPIFWGRQLTSVLVIFCGDDERHVGAIELWRNDAAESTDMKLDEGYYGGTAEVFEFVSRHTSFRKGFGLPGLVWESGLPLFMPDLGKSTRFVRADSALTVGINRGFALPCATPGDDAFVLAFLSALATPIVRRFETWLPDAERRHLLRREGFCERFGALDAAPVGERLAASEGVIGRAFIDGRPAISNDAANEPAGAGAGARSAGLDALVAIPIFGDGCVPAVVVWYF